jgi:hypothetical protein
MRYFLLRYISAVAISLTTMVASTMIMAYRYFDGTPLALVVLAGLNAS